MNTEFDELLRDGMERFTADLRAPANLAARARASRTKRLTVRTAASGVAAVTVAGITFAAIPATTAPVSVGVDRHGLTERFDIERVQITRGGQISGQAWIYHERLRLLDVSSGRPIKDEGSAVVRAKDGHHRGGITIVDYRRKDHCGRGGGATPSPLSPRASPAICVPRSAYPESGAPCLPGSRESTS